MTDVMDVINMGDSVCENGYVLFGFLKKLKRELPYNPTYFTSGYVPKRNKIKVSERYLYTMFTAALFITAKTWKQSKCPLTDEWMSKCGIYIQRNIIYL